MAYEIDWDQVNTNVGRLGIWLYWIAGLTFAFSISYVLFSNNKQVASILVFLLSVLAIYYYYVKWIVIGDEFKIANGPCPDMLVSIGFYNEDNKQYVCVDKNGNFPNMEADGASYTLDQAISNAKSSIKTATGGVDTVKGIVITPDYSDPAKLKTFCNELSTYGMTWTGACNNVA